MQFKGIELCCPACRGDLTERPGAEPEFRCNQCGRGFPVILGIPDLRIFPDPYIDFAADRAKGVELAEHSDTLDLAALVEYYYLHTPVVPPHHARMYTRGLLAGAVRSQQALISWEAAVGGPATRSDHQMLEIGCGTAPFLVAAAARYPRLVGVDVAFRWLVVAQKRLAEAGLDLPLICGNAEALPFRPQTFDRVVAESVLEHVQDQSRVLAECWRVLRPHGWLYVATPNRLSLGPDPHTGIWAGGLLPRRWVEALVRRQGGIPPKRRLLSARSLRRTLVQAGFGAPEIWLPAITPTQRSLVGRKIQVLIDAYMALRRFSISRRVLLWIGPLFYAVAERSSIDPGLETAAKAEGQ